MNKKQVDDGSLPLQMRGWLRLWISLTIVWLIGVAIFARMKWPPSWIPPAYAIRVRDAGTLQRETAGRVAALAILPPVGMLLSAAMARWVYRGFK
jgi:hypothetical protein